MRTPEQRRANPSPRDRPWRERSNGGGREGTRNGESSTNLCGGPQGSTRALSPRQLPTDHDYAVPTREYQSDQPSRQPTRPPPMLHALELKYEEEKRRIEENA